MTFQESRQATCRQCWGNLVLSLPMSAYHPRPSTSQPSAAQRARLAEGAPASEYPALGRLVDARARGPRNATVRHVDQEQHLAARARLGPRSAKSRQPQRRRERAPAGAGTTTSDDPKADGERASSRPRIGPKSKWTSHRPRVGIKFAHPPPIRHPLSLSLPRAATARFTWFSVTLRRVCLHAP